MSESKSIGITTVAPPTWPETCKDEVAEIISRYPEDQGRSAVMPLLHLAMRERDGHFVAISDLEAIGQILGLSTAYVESVCTFYAMYHRHPVGKYVITICASMVCHMLGGGKELIEHIKEAYDLTHGETTPDGLITLEVTGECLAACDLAPVIHLNTEYVVKVTPEKFDALVAHLRAGNDPAAFLEKLPLMNGADQSQWQGFQEGGAQL